MLSLVLPLGMYRVLPFGGVTGVAILGDVWCCHRGRVAMCCCIVGEPKLFWNLESYF